MFLLKQRRIQVLSQVPSDLGLTPFPAHLAWFPQMHRHLPPEALFFVPSAKYTVTMTLCHAPRNSPTSQNTAAHVLSRLVEDEIVMEDWEPFLSFHGVLAKFSSDPACLCVIHFSPITPRNALRP